MLSSLNSGVSGIQQMQQRMDVIGNNIANVNTTGFKSGRALFADTFSQAIGGPSFQVGSGVTTSSIRNQFLQGTISATGTPTDLAIDGNGFFLVKNPADGGVFATRSGDFHRDTGGYLVNDSGFRVQGFTDPGRTTRGDILIDATGAPATSDPAATVAGFTFDVQGQLTVKLSDGTSFVRGQVLLQDFTNPQALVKEGGNLYSGLAAAGPLAETKAPKSNGLGGIAAGALETSNVDLTSEFASLITTQRAFQANAKIITTSDEMLQEAVNLKR
jgi:flagellar hook protein FlgE